MMKAIIVDDEVQTVRAIKYSVNWDKLNISEVFTAYNIAHAKEIFAKEIIDIAVCDIEMPQGSGLDLLQWMKKMNLETESILLTSHSEFEFAKQAIALGCMDYLVKPIPFDQLEEVIAKAITEINVKRQLKEYSKYGEFWVNNQGIIEKSFWSELLRGNLSGGPSDIAEQAKMRNVLYKVDEQYQLIMISKKRLSMNLNEWNENMLDFALKKVASEMITNDKKADSSFFLDGQLIVLVRSTENIDTIRKECNKYIRFCEKKFACQVSCYIGGVVYGEQLADMYLKLKEMDKNNVAQICKVFDINEGNTAIDSEFDIFKVNLEWTLMLHKGEKEQLVNAIKNNIQCLAEEERLNGQVLSIIQQDILQMVYAFLEQKGIQAHQLFKDDTSQDLYNHSRNSTECMMNWIHYFINKTIDFTDKVTKSQSVISKVKDYIKNNLKSNISRDDIANYVFLNPDYLTRIFKKSTGQSLTEYINDQRIERSTFLLIHSETPISDIALDVGYDNFSYYSKVFKKMTGMTPSEYRKEYRKSFKKSLQSIN